MSYIKKDKGSSVIEFVYALLFLLAFVFIVKQFALLGDASHDLSINLQNKVDEKMLEAGRPPCLLEEFGERIVKVRSTQQIFSDEGVEKSLIFVTRSTCGGSEI